jgi:hypothetical protein
MTTEIEAGASQSQYSTKRRALRSILCDRNAAETGLYLLGSGNSETVRALGGELRAPTQLAGLCGSITNWLRPA